MIIHALVAKASTITQPEGHGGDVDRIREVSPLVTTAKCIHSIAETSMPEISTFSLVATLSDVGTCYSASI